MPTLDGVRRKLDRARHHHDQLVREANELTRTYAAETFTQAFDGGAVHEVTLGDVPDPPHHWGTLVGDVLHNTRSALDHLAWQLVLLSGGTPNDRTQFPIVDNRPDRPLTVPGGVTPEILEKIESRQPYAVDGIHPLAVLRELSNIDKHRELLPVVARTVTAGYGIPDGIDVRFRFAREPLTAGAVVGHLHIDPPQLDLDFGMWMTYEVRLDPTIGRAFVHVGDLPGWALGVALSYTERTVALFDPLFDAEGS